MLGHLALAAERNYCAWLRRYCDFLKRLPLRMPSKHKLERFATLLPAANAQHTELQERIRLVKEGEIANDETIEQAMRHAQKEIEAEVLFQVAPILAGGWAKIHAPQWHDLKILIGGGGTDTPLYRRAVNEWFEQFSHFRPEPIPIPLPNDLRWPSAIPEANRSKLFRRFSVAYGLSFDRANLDDHRFPGDVPPLPPPTEPPPLRSQAPTKDEC
jgi:hypothetical protein